MTDVTVLMPNIPKLLTVDVPPINYCGSSFPYLALFAMSFVLFAISTNPNVYALKTIGVINPPSVATATLTSECLNLFITLPCHCELTTG